jgi:sulfate transport system substrate-binding protein
MGKGVWLVILALSLALTTVRCQPSVVQPGEPIRHTIIVYSFSVEEEVMTEEVFPAFQSQWREKTGQEVIFQSVFDSSDGLTKAILDGGSADVAILSNEQHAIWLRINDWVETDWHTRPHEGIISHSPLVIVVRPGNPLGIANWVDLARPGVSLVHPDPHTSGGAQWALLAEYGSALLDGRNGDREAAREQLRDIWANVVAAPPSAREALKEFVFGAGDALVTYEQDALLAQARGAALEVVTPHSTVVSEHVAVIVDRNVKPWERKVVEAFVDFLWSEAVQEALTSYYFRAVTDEALNRAVPEFHAIEHPFTVYDLGGWGQAYPEIIHEIWEDQILKGLIEKQVK